MHKLVGGIILIFCCVSQVLAQSNDSPRADFFVGYSVLRTNYEAQRSLPFEPVVTAFSGKQTLNGFNVSATGYIKRGFGLTADFSGHFITDSVPSALGGNIKTKVRSFNILGGPQYKFNNRSRAVPFVRALAGVAHTRSRLNVSRSNITDINSSTDLALALGGGLDIRVNRRFDLRVFQTDYNPVFLRRSNEFGFGNTRGDNIRFSFGLVFKK